MATNNSINLPEGSAGQIVRNTGTGFTNSTATFADTYGASTVLYSNGANTVTGLATGNDGVLVTSGTGVPSISSTLPQAVINNFSSPQVTVYITGSGTYSTPSNAKYLQVEVLGGGGGGGGGGSGSPGNGASGANSTFGTALLTANGGALGGAAGVGGAGGTATGGDVNLTGGAGGSGGSVTGGSLYGGQGGLSFFGGGSPMSNSAGINAAINSGSGGAGGAANGPNVSGGGGGAGGYVRKLITSPLSTYAYTVGGTAAGGSAGTGGGTGGGGAAGIIIVTAYFQ